MYRLLLIVLLGGLPGQSSAQTDAATIRSPAPVAMNSPAAVAAVMALRRDLAQLIASPRWRGDRWGALVVSLESGDTLFSHEADASLAPASNVKLFTSAAALYYLGPQYRFHTFLLADGVAQDSILHGDLVLYGTGDPTVARRFGYGSVVWEAFADTLAALGIREVRGDVVGDGSYFRGAGAAQGWQLGYVDAAYAAPAGALSYAENVATVRVEPSAQAGGIPDVTLVPGRDGAIIVNQATTVARGRSTIRVSRDAYDGPVLVTGQIPARSRGVLRSLPVSDPARFTAAVFREVLEERGIAITGGVRSVDDATASPVTGRSVFAPAFEQKAPLRVLAIHESPPLLTILEVINKRSHNLLAEQVLRAVGRVAVGDGSVEGGVRAVEHMLTEESNGEPPAVDLYDGSGLSVLNRASARSFVELLSMMQDSPMWENFWSTLPEAGARDGLRRMGRTPAEGNLRAKTGTISRVSALSGYVQAANGEPLAFSILANDVPSTWRAKRVEDAIGARLASFTRPRGPAQASGEPARAAMEADAPAVQPSTAASTESTPAATRHRVGRGETMDGIARRYGITVAALRAANPGLEPRRMQAGSSIRIPSGTQTQAEAAAEPAPERQHTIRSGDTLDGIARRYGTTVAALQRANPDLNPRRLLPGQRIRVP